jgi:hypothetical protein
MQGLLRDTFIGYGGRIYFSVGSTTGMGLVRSQCTVMQPTVQSSGARNDAT